MKRQKEWLISIVALGFVCVLAMQVGNVSWLIAPLWLIGNGLRWLSLSGALGNGIAWAFVVGAAVLPLVYMGVRKVRNGYIAADWLLPVLALQIASLLYFLVNPTLTDYPGGLPLADGFALIYVGAMVATAVGYAFLRVLKRVDLDATSGRMLPQLLEIGGLILVFATSYNHLAVLIGRVNAVSEANTGDVSFTVAVLAILAMCSFVPALLGGVTLLRSGAVAKALMEEPYAEETVALCGKTANFCNKVAVCSILVSVGCNLVQIVLASKLYQANINVELPLLTLLLSSALYLLCHYIGGAKELVDDNNSII